MLQKHKSTAEEVSKRTREKRVFGFIFNKLNLMAERFAVSDGPARFYLVNEFDESGRITSSVRLAEEGLETRVCYEKYKYPDDKLIWNKRQIFSMEKLYDTEEDILSGRIDVKTQALRFHDNMDTEATGFYETRKP